MKIALLGLEQAGKKTLFSLLTGRRAPEARKDTETVEGIAPVRDPRVDALTAIFKPERSRYAENVITLCHDIQPGAPKRPWLETARKSDLLCPMVRAFVAESVYHPAGSVDAQRDQTSLETEIVLADLEMIETRLTRIDKEKRGSSPAAQDVERTALVKAQSAIEQAGRPCPVNLEAHELDAIKSLGLLCLKPVLWIRNVDEDKLSGLQDNGGAFAVSCRIEEEIMRLDSEAERIEYLQALGVSSSGLDRWNRAAYQALGLLSFFTVGSDEVRAWTVKKGAAAPEAAGKVHSDMERGFIRVEVIKYEDLIAAGGEAEAKAAGKLKLKGREYIVEDGDICHFLFNV